MIHAAHSMLPLRRQRGVTLVELMIAMLLGLVLIAGIIQVFLGNRQTYQFNEDLARIQENARFAIDTLNYRTRMAGYLGCIADIEVFNNLDVPADDFTFSLGEAIRGFEATGTGVGQTLNLPSAAGTTADWGPNLDPALFAAGNPPLVGSDIFIVRNISTESTALVPPYQQSAGVFTDAEVGQYERGDILVVTDCQKASLFQVTGNPPGPSGQSVGIRVNHSQDGVPQPGNDVVVWPSNQQYTAGSELSRMESYAFYVAIGQDGGPALFQRRLVRSGTNAMMQSEELVDGVENMQVLYGVDLNGNLAVDEYRTANNVADWDQVASVRVSLLMRAPQEYGTETDSQLYDVNGTRVQAPDDRRLRQVYTTTVTLRNRMP